jgi:uncharacterized protein YjbJ (UPF0337 family)
MMSEHRGEELKGRVEEATGDLTGDKALQQEGKVDQASAATKKQIDDVADAIKDIVTPKKS